MIFRKHRQHCCDSKTVQVGSLIYFAPPLKNTVTFTIFKQIRSFQGNYFGFEVSFSFLFKQHFDSKRFACARSIHERRAPILQQTDRDWCKPKMYTFEAQIPCRHCSRTLYCVVTPSLCRVLMIWQPTSKRYSHAAHIARLTKSSEKHNPYVRPANLNLNAWHAGS